MLKVFQAVADIATGAAARVTDEHSEFLEFFRSLVETVSPEVAKQFGTLSVTVVTKGKTEGWGIELTATDYLWWKDAIAKGSRFSPDHGGVESVPRAMVVRVASKAEKSGLTLEERRALVTLLDGIG